MFARSAAQLEHKVLAKLLPYSFAVWHRAATAAAIGAVILCGGGTRCFEAGGGGRTNRVHMVSVFAWLCVCDGGDDLLISAS